MASEAFEDSDVLSVFSVFDDFLVSFLLVDLSVFCSHFVLLIKLSRAIFVTGTVGLLGVIVSAL